MAGNVKYTPRISCGARIVKMHLRNDGASRRFSRAVALVWGFSRSKTGLPSMGSHRVGHD